MIGELLSRAGTLVDPDRALMAATTGVIEAAARRRALGMQPETWRPGKPLKLLLAGYAGTRNTGADVRVEEMIRQIRAVLGDDRVQISLMTFDPAASARYFRAVRQVRMPVLFPPFLFEECPRHHGVVACEGSMFKSKFANALSTMMAGSLGMAGAEAKLAVGYGAEAGAMDPPLHRFVQRHCRDALVICRNAASRDVLEPMGIRTRPGADTAWTFAPAPPEAGAALLREVGWDGRTPVLAICPINPFWWPVRPDLPRAAAWRLLGRHRREHYRSVYFHQRSLKDDRRYAAYVGAIAGAVRAFSAERRLFPVLVGMERLDREACRDVATCLAEGGGSRPPLLVSDDHDMYELVSALRQASWLVSSRFHAVVTSMPGGVPSVGITMDERIRNLMRDRGTPELCLEVDDPELEPRLLDALRRLEQDREEIALRTARFIPGELRKMGEMAMDLCDEIARVYPDFERPDRPRTWEAHLPPLPPEVAAILEEHGGEAGG